MTTVPATRQLEFLRNIQRLLTDGKFTATYKYALLMALADLSVSEGDDTDAPLTLSTRQIAQRFFSLYERQSIQFPGSRETLRQNAGRQAAIVRYIKKARARYSARRHDLRRHSALITKIDSTVRHMPLAKLQRVGDDIVPFLYDQPKENQHEITLHSGVAACFRTFYPLIISTIQAVWMRAVRKLNPALLGERTDLGAFMFGAARSNLDAYREVLENIQDGRCFYTGRRLDRESEVDHFIPWSRYPVDLGHNFVLASPAANRAKLDSLASEKHLEKWLTQVSSNHYTLDTEFESRSLPHSWPGSLNIATWAYEQASSTRESVWVTGRTQTVLTGEWRDLLGEAIQTLERAPNRLD